MIDGPRSDSTASSRRPIAKAVQLLSWMVDSPAHHWGVRELARGVGLPPATVHRLLTTLLEEGFVELDGSSSRYELGPEFFRLALKLAGGLNINYIARPFLEDLSAMWDETVFLSTYDPRRRRAMFVDTVESSQQLRYVVPLYEWMPVPHAASGLAILAYLPADEVEEVLSEPDVQTQIDFPQLQQELERVRTRGYALTAGMRVPGAVGIAAPIFSHADRVVGDVGLSIPEQRFVEADREELARSVVLCADQISRQLGSLHAPKPV